MIISYLVNNNINAILFFILISILAYLFTKNMIIILGCAIILTFIIYSIQSISNNKLYSDALSSYNYSFIEGMENKEDKDNDVGESLMELKKQNKKLETKISDKQNNKEVKKNQEGEEVEEKQEGEEKQEYEEKREYEEKKEVGKNKNAFTNMGNRKNLNPADI